MPIHDWTRVSAGGFHDFHVTWIVHLKELLNAGRLPAGYYAMAEQQAARMQVDLLTLEKPSIGAPWTDKSEGAQALATAVPLIGRKRTAGPNAVYRTLRRTITIRHVSDHRVVALVEIASPANKDRASSVEEFVSMCHAALRQGVHLLLVDLFPPGRHDPSGLHGAIWETMDSEEDHPPDGQPLCTAAYDAVMPPEAYVEFLAVGQSLPDMPLFLEPGRHVTAPLKESYDQAYASLPPVWKETLEVSK